MISSESQDQVSGQVVIPVRRVMPLKCTRPFSGLLRGVCSSHSEYYSGGWVTESSLLHLGFWRVDFLHYCLPVAAALLQCASFLRGIIEWFIAAAARAAQGETSDEEDCIGNACMQTALCDNGVH